MKRKLIILYFSIIQKLNKWLLNKSYKAAEAKAKKLHEQTGKKILILLYKKDYEAVPKQDFKVIWNNRPAMKKRSVQQWLNSYAEEYKPNKQPLNGLSTNSRTNHTKASEYN